MNTLEKVKELNKAYREGNSLVSDSEYDSLYDSLSSKEKEEIGIGIEPQDRKQKLPYPMFSMDKIKKPEEIRKWMKSKGIPEDTLFVITPKYDGLSFLCDTNYPQNRYYTRGNGIEGQRSDEHYSVIQSTLQSVPTVEELENNYIFGEVIISKKKFVEKYSSNFKNARNLMAGLLNNKVPQRELEDVDFIRYGVGNEEYNKLETLELLNRINHITVPYAKGTIDMITVSILTDLYTDWKKTYEIDGLILEVNDKELRKKLGRERSGNPAYARALKLFEEDSETTTIIGHTLNVSKDGRITFVGQVDNVELDGVTISNVTLNNAKMILDEGWKVGAEVEIIRSGSVIPKIINTVKRGTGDLPTNCPSCGSKLSWCPTQTNLICNNKVDCREQKMSETSSFMGILGIENVGDGVVSQLYDYGFLTYTDIITKMTKENLLQVEGFAKRKAEIVYNNIMSKLQNVELSKIQHAMNLFSGLGSKKLKLLEHFDSKNNIPTKEEIIKIDGFSDISADIYLNGIYKFWEEVEKLPITISKKEEVVVSGEKFQGNVFVFTGVRRKDLEEIIVSQGGTIGSGVTKNTTHLICKDKESNSSKIVKARDLGCFIMEVQALEEMIKL